MDTDGTDFHGFLSVLIREIRVYPCPDFKLSGDQVRFHYAFCIQTYITLSILSNRGHISTSLQDNYSQLSYKTFHPPNIRVRPERRPRPRLICFNIRCIWRY